MSNIYFVEDTGNLRLDLSGRTLSLYHPKYQAVQVPGATVMAWAAFCERFKREPELLDVDNLVIAGTNRIINPGNRTDPIFEALYSGTMHINKISVDVVPFISVPWRIWFHFGLVNRTYGRYDYSYAIESDYNMFLDGAADYNPCSLDEMIAWSQGVVSIRRGPYFKAPQVITLDVLPDVVGEYEDLRDRLLETEQTPKGVLSKLGRFAQDHCPQRQIPQPHAAFNKPGARIIKTNLKIDDYLVVQLLDTFDLVNNYLEALNEL